MTVFLRELDRLLIHAERVIALLERCRPTNAVAELSRLADADRRGLAAVPRFRYAPPPKVDALIDALEGAIEMADRAGPWAILYAQRAEELRQEAELVAAVGTERFAELARRRFSVEETLAGRWADRVAQAWAGEPPPEAVACVRSDDEDNPGSLVSRMRRAVGRLRLPFRVEVRDCLASAAATGDGRIVVRAGLFHSDNEAERIVAHEIQGHALPRDNARSQSIGLFRVGTCGADVDEEGRALLIEKRLGLLGAERRRQLAVRHLASVAVRGGADWWETVKLAKESGAGSEEAIRVAARAHRGGGLAREIVYLPALRRVEEAFARDPSLERWFRLGRVSVDGARWLEQLGVPAELIRPKRPVLEPQAPAHARKASPLFSSWS